MRIERVIAAPRELVFRLWTKPEYLVRWFAPRRCTLEIHAVSRLELFYHPLASYCHKVLS